MESISLQQCARELGVSYESIRRQVVRYKDDLKDHILKSGKTQYLDRFAVEFLKDHRRKNTMQVVRQDQTDIINAQRQQMDDLKAHLMEAQDQIIELQKEIAETLEAKIRNEYLLEDNSRLKEDLQKQTEAAIKAKTEAEATQEEIKSFHKTIFGLYRKRKDK